MKKVISLLLIFTIILGAVPVFSEEAALTYGNFIYEITDESTVLVTGVVDNTVTEIVIPKEIEGKSVEVNSYAFTGCENLETADLTNLSSVPDGAFKNCAKLKNVYLSENNFKIGTKAFENCTSLTYIDLKDTEKVESFAFFGCERLEEAYFTIGTRYQNIGEKAFANCTSLKYIDLYEVKSLGSYAFENCVSLEFVWLDSLKEFQGSPFKNCENLKYAYVTNDKTAISNYQTLFYSTKSDYFPQSNDLKVFWGKDAYKQQKNYAYTIAEENGVKTMTITGYVEGLDYNRNIDDYITERSYYKDVDIVVIEETVQRIGSKAFKDMPNLKEVIIKSPFVEIGSQAFYNCDNLEKIEFPKYGRIELNDSIFDDCDKLEKVEIKPSVLILGSNSFAACDKLTEVAFPERGEVKIGKGAFALCDTTQIRLTGGIRSIDADAFENCDKITKIIIGKDFDDSILGATWRYNADFVPNIFTNIESVETIEVEEGNKFYKVVDNVLYNYPMATLYRYLPSKEDKEFTIPYGVEYIRNGAFKGEKNLDVVNVPGSVVEIDTCSFGEVTLEKLNIEEGVKKIYGHAFLHSTIKNLVIPESMERLYSYSYNLTPKTTAVAYVLKGSVNNIHYRGKEARLDLWDITEYVDNVNAFYNYKDEEYTDDNVYEFKDYKYYLTKAKNVDAEVVAIPDVINGYEVVINNGAFSNMPNLKRVILSEGVLVIPPDTFKNSTNLTDINLENVEYIGKDAFLGTRVESVSLLNIKEWETGFENMESIKTAYVKFPYDENKTPLFKNLKNLEKVYVINTNKFIHNEEFSNCEKAVIYSDVKAVREKFALKDMKTQKGRIECTYSQKDIEKGEKFSFLGGVYQYENGALYYLYPERNDGEIYIAAKISGMDVKLKDKVLRGNIFVRRVHLSEDIKEISSGAFSDCPALEYINLENVEKLGEAAFKNCDSLTEVTLLNINYWHGARYYDVDLKNMRAPYFAHYGARAPFTDCDNLTRMTVKWPTKFLGNDTLAERQSAGEYMHKLIPESVKEVYMLNAPKNINPYEFLNIVLDGSNKGTVSEVNKSDVIIYSDSKEVEKYAEREGLGFVAID